MPRVYTRRPVEERFWEKVDRRGPDECWPWTASRRNTAGHGAFGKAVASRVAYELAVGPIPEGFYVCHRCDNPPCVNPAHLFAADPRGNFDDMVSKGREGFRKNKPRGSSHPGAKLTEEKVRELRRMRQAGIKVNDIAVHFHVSVSLVEKILAGRFWTHVTESIA